MAQTHVRLCTLLWGKIGAFSVLVRVPIALRGHPVGCGQQGHTVPGSMVGLGDSHQSWWLDPPLPGVPGAGQPGLLLATDVCVCVRARPQLRSV